MDQLTWMGILAIACGLGAGLYWIRTHRRR